MVFCRHCWEELFTWLFHTLNRETEILWFRGQRTVICQTVYDAGMASVPKEEEEKTQALNK